MKIISYSCEVHCISCTVLVYYIIIILKSIRYVCNAYVSGRCQSVCGLQEHANRIFFFNTKAAGGNWLESEGACCVIQDYVTTSS